MIEQRILLFLEDPGAALFMQRLPKALRKDDLQPIVAAIRHAAPYFPSVDPVPEADQADLGAAAALLDRIRPSIIVLGTSEDPDSFAFRIIDEARERGIPTIGAVDSAANADNRFRGRGRHALAHSPDWLLVPDTKTADGFIGHGFDSARIRICGHPRLHEIDAIRREWTEAHQRAHRQKWFPAAENRKVIVFVSELSVGLGSDPFIQSDRYQLTGTTDRVKRTDIVMEELLHATRALPETPYMVLRLHPKQRIEEEARNIPLFDQVSRTEPSLEIVHAADLVVGMTSILLVEAATLGRPVLSIVPVPGEREWLGDVGARIPCASTRSEIAAALKPSGAAWAASAEAEGYPDSIATMTSLVRSVLAES